MYIWLFLLTVVSDSTILVILVIFSSFFLQKKPQNENIVQLLQSILSGKSCMHVNIFGISTWYGNKTTIKIFV